MAIESSSHVPELAQRILNNVVEIPQPEARKSVDHLLIPGENVLIGYQGVRDLVVFTDKRIVFNDKQGITGKKEEATSVPWDSIVAFSVKTPGKIDLDADVYLRVRDELVPRHLKFAKDDLPKVHALQRLIASHVLKKTAK